MLHEASSTLTVPFAADKVMDAVHDGFSTKVVEMFPGTTCERAGNELRFRGLRLPTGTGPLGVDLTLSGRIIARDLPDGTTSLTTTDIAELGTLPADRVALAVGYVAQAALTDAYGFRALAHHVLGVPAQGETRVANEAATTVTVPFEAEDVIDLIYEAFRETVPEAYPGVTCHRDGNEVRYQGLKISVGEGPARADLDLCGRIIVQDRGDGTSTLTTTTIIDLGAHPEQRAGLAASYAGQISLGDAVQFRNLVHQLLGGQAVA